MELWRMVFICRAQRKAKASVSSTYGDKLWGGGVRDIWDAPPWESHLLHLHHYSWESLFPLGSWHEQAQSSLVKRWRSWLPDYRIIYLQHGGRVLRLGTQAAEILIPPWLAHEKEKFMAVPRLFSYCFFWRLAVEERRSGAEHCFSLFAQTCNDEPPFDRCRSKLQKRC